MKFIILILLTTLLIFANSSGDKIKLKILQNICMGIETSKNMKIWSDEDSVKDAFISLHKFEVVNDFKKADLIILKNNFASLDKYKNKHIFVLDYNLLNKIPNSFGALFWKKGRPNIVFIKSRLDKQKLYLSSELKPYIEEKIW